MLNFINLLENSALTEATTDCMGIAVPNSIFNLVSTIINGIKIVVPVLLIIWGMLDFAKAIISKKEDDIKSHQKLFVSRLISAVLVFFIIWAVQLVFSLLSKVQENSGNTNDTASIWECSKNFVTGVEYEKSEENE